MQHQAPRPFRFFVERLIQKGIFGQLVLMAALVVLVAIAGGLVAWAATPQFENPFDAIWWAFLRLTDPGYLGDDEGVILRTISTTVTILGYVLFMGSMIAIMTQWLSRTMAQLESGVTPIAMRNHVVILGWTNRTPEIVVKLLGARGRLQRFLANSEQRKLRIVVQSDNVNSERRTELREYLGDSWNESQIFLRSGSSLQAEHLARLDLLRASVILIPGADFELGGSEMTDTRVIKTLMTVSGEFRRSGSKKHPRVVAEVFDPHKFPIARNTIGEGLEVVASNRIIGRLISQSVRHRGLGRILCGIFSHRQGDSIFLRNLPELAGESPQAVAHRFDQAVVLGLLRRVAGADRVLMDPRSEEVLAPDDLLIFLARAHDDCQPNARASAASRTLEASELPQTKVAPQERSHRVLVLGWSHKIVTLIAELNESTAGRFDLTIMSRVSLKSRNRWLKRVEAESERVQAHNINGDYSVLPDLVAVDPASFDHVVFMASDWMNSSEEADARTILGHALLRAVLEESDKAPEILVELTDPNSSSLFQQNQDVVLVTPRILSHLLAHVTLRAELNSVFDELFGAGGSEIDLEPAGALGLAGQTVAFPKIQQVARQHGLVALGILGASGTSEDIHLNPDRAQQWTLADGDSVVVLAT